MNFVRRKFKDKFPKLAANISLALTFGAFGALSKVVLANVYEGVGVYSWLVLILVAGAFLLRALGDLLELDDKRAEVFLKRIGIQQRCSRKRMTKDLMLIIATILATATVFPFFKALGTVRSVFQSVTAITASEIIFLFVYDIACTFYRTLQEKVCAVADWFGLKQIEEMK